MGSRMKRVAADFLAFAAAMGSVPRLFSYLYPGPMHSPFSRSEWL